ncbi:polysaccharide biosynthesis tyrosine autokinase [bacterium]|nr:MAG: polysaccharide biosynthesis tyrosine autokinase [bacterium]
MNQSSHPLDNTNGASSNGELAYIERRTASNSISPPNEWREPYGTNASGRYAVEESGGLDLAQILGIGRRRWKWMLAVMVVCVSVSAILVWRSKPVYQSMATLELTANNKPQMDTSAVPGLEQFAGNNNSARALVTQLEIIKGPTVKDAAVANMDAAQRARLRGIGMEANQRGNTNLVDVTVRSLDPVGASDFANEICDAYVKISQQANAQNSVHAVDYVKTKALGIGDNLKKAQDELILFKKKRGVMTLSDEAAAITSSLGSKKLALEQAQTQRASLVAQLNDQQSQLSGIPESRLVPTGIQKNPVIAQLQQRITEKKIERDSLLNEYTESSVRVTAIDAEIASLKSQLDKQVKTEVTSFQPDPRRAPLVQSVAMLQSQVLSTDATINALKQQIVIAQGQVKQLPELEVEYASLMNNVDLQTGLAKQMQQTLANLEITANSQTADAVVRFKASPNYGPVAPDKRRIILTGIIMGLLSALALAMIVDALDNRIYTEDDVQRATQLPVLAQIPFIKKADQQSLYLTGESVSPLLESNRMLRANISFCATDRPVKAIIVTSSVPHEGKSSSALNLAVAAALGGERVVLIDLDLRRPTQHVLTGLPNTAGFTNIIAGQTDLETALQDTPIQNLQVLTSGPTPPNPYRMLNSHAAKSTIEAVIAMADFVVIDTPPVLGLADARLISSLVDGTLMVISAQETGRREANRAADMMVSANQEVLGAVLTKVPSSSTAYGSYTSQRYGRYFDEGQSTAEKMDESALAGKLDAAPRDRKKS